LQSGIGQMHRAGVAGSNTIFKITVPPGIKRLTVLTRGGRGTIAVIVRKGAPRPVGFHDFKRVGVANRTDFAVPLPAAGDWFIEVRGRTDFSGCTVQASYRSIKADLIVWPDALMPYQTTETFERGDCEVEEGMITAGTHRLLRFTTESRNIGGGNLVMGRPEGNPNFEFQECHGHYHFKGFAAYELLDLNGAVVARGRKVSFCLEDVFRWDRTAPVAERYDCQNQGIQAGWSDIYDGGLPGQWIDITDIPVGEYQLAITINPDRLLDEADYTNNTTTVPVTITGP
jgi:Lysyl oxidase